MSYWYGGGHQGRILNLMPPERALFPWQHPRTNHQIHDQPHPQNPYRLAPASSIFTNSATYFQT